jgi:hypothetical protein
MAKRGGDDETGSEKGKIRIFFAEVEGNNQSLQDALKTVVAAMNRPIQLAAARLPANGQNALATTAAAEGGAPQETVEEAGNEELVEESAESTPVRKRRTGPKADRNVGIKLVPNLDFRPEGKPALKEFFAEKAPKTDMEQTLVISYFLQHMVEVPAFGPGHVLTGFKEVQKPVPVDLRGTIRNMKNQKAWLNFSSIEEIALTTQGDNFVEHELGVSS